MGGLRALTMLRVCQQSWLHCVRQSMVGVLNWSRLPGDAGQVEQRRRVRLLAVLLVLPVYALWCCQESVGGRDRVKSPWIADRVEVSCWWLGSTSVRWCGGSAVELGPPKCSARLPLVVWSCLLSLPRAPDRMACLYRHLPLCCLKAGQQ